MVLEKTLEIHLDYEEIKPVNPKGNQPWIFIGWDWCWSSNFSTLAAWCRIDPLGKNPDAGKDWKQIEKGMIEDDIVR